MDILTVLTLFFLFVSLRIYLVLLALLSSSLSLYSTDVEHGLQRVTHISKDDGIGVLHWQEGCHSIHAVLVDSTSTWNTHARTHAHTHTHHVSFTVGKKTSLPGWVLTNQNSMQTEGKIWSQTWGWDQSRKVSEDSPRNKSHVHFKTVSAWRWEAYNFVHTWPCLLKWVGWML